MTDLTETKEQCRARLLALAAQHNPAHTTPKLVEQWVEEELRLRGFDGRRHEEMPNE